MTRATSSALMLMALCAAPACGAHQELDVQVDDMESMLAESRRAVAGYAEADGTEQWSADGCATQLRRYCDAMVERISRMNMRASALDQCVMGMGHRGEADLGDAASELTATVEQYRSDGCPGAPAQNQETARAHARAMHGTFDRMEQRCGELRMMQMQGMRCGG